MCLAGCVLGLSEVSCCLVPVVVFLFLFVMYLYEAEVAGMCMWFVSLVLVLGFRVGEELFVVVSVGCCFACSVVVRGSQARQPFVPAPRFPSPGSVGICLGWRCKLWCRRRMGNCGSGRSHRCSCCFDGSCGSCISRWA